MACGCPLVTSQVSSMPEIAGGAANPPIPPPSPRPLVAGVAPDRDRLRDMGLRRAGEFTWTAAAASTLDVYREVAERRRRRRA
jgi:glycosyltransferase involved in cell wall biosynthesis